MDISTQARFKQQLEELAEELREGLKPTDQTATVKLDTSIGRLSRMDEMQFMDAIHLNAAGTAAFSRRLAVEMHRRYPKDGS